MQAIARRHLRNPGAVVVASDNPARLEQLVNATLRANGKLKGVPVVATDDRDGVVVHSMELRLHAWRDKRPDEQQLGFLRLWVDFFLLAEAHTLVFMQSGFSRVACYTSMTRARSKGACHELQKIETTLEDCR